MERKGITFELMSKQEAANYLTNNTYYFKIKSYAKAFEFNERKQKYIHVDFAYLVELAKLDMYVRLFIMKLALNCEHCLKVKLLNDITENTKEDGYQIVYDFLYTYPHIRSSIKLKSINSASADLIRKYGGKWSAWSIVEVLSFGEFIKLYQLYYDVYRIDDNDIDLLWSLKFLRNATAHNSCLLNTLRKPYRHTHLSNKKGVIQPTKSLINLVSKVEGVGKQARKKKLKNPIIHDFIASLFLFDHICTSPALKQNMMNELLDLIHVRFTKHSDYFKYNLVVVSSYDFLKKTIDYIVKIEV